METGREGGNEGEWKCVQETINQKRRLIHWGSSIMYDAMGPLAPHCDRWLMAAIFDFLQIRTSVILVSTLVVLTDL